MFTQQDLLAAIARHYDALARFVEEGFNPGHDEFWEYKADYHCYLDTLRAFQLSNNISGLIEVTQKVGDRAITYHETHPDLKTTDSDFLVLKAEKDRVVKFFLETEKDAMVKFDTYYVDSDGENYSAITSEKILELASDADYADIRYNFYWCPQNGGMCKKEPFEGSIYSAELYLTLGTGKPETTIYKDGTGTSEHISKYGEQS